MDVGKERLTDFIGDKRIFIIPVYQRNYDWQQDNCKRMFDDIERIIKANRPHFFGTFVYQHIPTVGQYQKFIIIDGQQRLTSTILLAKALYDSTNDEELRDNIKSSLWKHSKGKTTYNFKLKPLEYDRNIFEKLIDCDKFDENIFSEEDKSSSIYHNYKFFKELVNSSSFDVSQIFDAIYGLEVVGILLDKENPQEIFESLNSTGLDLSNNDLIRNYLLMPLTDTDYQEELYKKYWLQLEKLINPDNMELFITHYLITKRRSDSIIQNDKKARLSIKNLYRSFKEYFEDDKNFNKNQNKIEDFFKDMLRYANFYKHFLFNENTVFSKLSKLDKKFYELMYLLDSLHSPIILMYLYDKYDEGKINEDTFLKFIDVLISFTFRAKICRTKVISSQFAGNVINKLDDMDINNNSIEDFWDVITFGKGNYAFPKDKQFSDALINESLYTTIKSDGCKYLLYSLELNSGHSKEIPSYDKSSIEHIIPQKLNNDWKKYLNSKNDFEIYRQYLHTLGNLTLTNYNEKLQNVNFNTKKEEYIQSNYYYTKELSAYNDWTSKQIRLRAEKLANLALKIWILPEKYNKNLPVSEKIFNLDSDSDLFKGTQLDTVSIFGKDKHIKYWSHFLIEISKQFYTIDKNLFKQAVSKDNVPMRSILLSTSKYNSMRSFALDNELYICTNFSAIDIFKIIRAIVKNFDSISKTNFKDDIWFTLKNN
ncbi:MAG: DUF262 domain-containing protein [Selenomonadaceae bacterium]|nr:DUF262 domain-containing protein [Selenomonadaceae bacterium]